MAGGVASEDDARAGLTRAVRIVCLGLVVLDLALAIAFTWFSDRAVQAIAPAGYAEPQFFQRCVGVSLLQYVFVQYLGYRDPRRWATALTMTVAVRSSFAILYVAEVALWGSPFTVLHGLFIAASVLDAATTIFLLVAMARLGIGLFQGDTAAPPDAPASQFLRILLLILAIAELVMGTAWLLAAKWLCGLFDFGFVVDPFWTRATGVFLINIAFIQYLGFRDPNRYRSAVLTSGVFRALWPILYWVTVAHGEGNHLFRTGIMGFSFFNIISCATIFWLAHRMSARTRTDSWAP